MMLSVFCIALSLVTFSDAFFDLDMKSHDRPESMKLRSKPGTFHVKSGSSHYQMGNLFENHKFNPKKVPANSAPMGLKGTKHFPMKQNILGKPDRPWSSNVSGSLGIVNPVKPVSPYGGHHPSSNLASALDPGTSKLAQYLENATKPEDALNKALHGTAKPLGGLPNKTGPQKLNPGIGPGKTPLSSAFGAGSKPLPAAAKPINGLTNAPSSFDVAAVKPHMPYAIGPFGEAEDAAGIGAAAGPGSPHIPNSPVGGWETPPLAAGVGAANVSPAISAGGPVNPLLPNGVGSVGGAANSHLPTPGPGINPGLSVNPHITNTGAGTNPDGSVNPALPPGTAPVHGSSNPQLPPHGTAINPGFPSNPQLPNSGHPAQQLLPANTGVAGQAPPGSLSPYNAANSLGQPAMPWNNSRLPSNVIPLHYTIVLRPNLTEGYFEGYCSIQVQVKNFTKVILLHSHGLNYSEISVSLSSGPTAEANMLTNFFPSPKFEYLVLMVESGLQVGATYQVQLEFLGNMQDGKLVGLYRSKYTTKDGQERFLALTKFQPTDARRAFPCFDEPEYKANFLVSVIHDAHYTALGNMPAMKSSVLNNGLILTEFSESVRMSTYLVAIIVSDFQFTSGKTQAGTEVRVFARAEQIQSTYYAVEVAILALNFFADYFGTPYPLPKSDLVAIPDFKSGAMENWGLISFRETSLLYNGQDSSIGDKEEAMRTTIHELGHMWFGNLVTMKWWNDLWLNEGFARFTEQLAGGVVQPTWQMHELFVVDVMERVMLKEEGSQSHPIEMVVASPEDINSIFDSITYEKGASVIYMLEAILGSNVFRAGLQNYLKFFAFGNTVTLDLWNKLTEASNSKLDVGKFMGTWTKQEGFPVVRIEQNKQYPNQLMAVQERFFSMPNDSLTLDLSKSAFNYLWELPLTYISPLNGSLAVHWMHQTKQAVFEVPSSNTPIKFNANSTGFYRVNYEENTWLSFAQQLMVNHKSLTRPDRANLLDDVFSLSKGGYTPYQLAFEMVRYLPNEEDFLPLRAVVPHLVSLTRRLQDSELYPLVRKFCTDLLTPIYHKLGWVDQSNDFHIISSRTLILTAMCTFGYQPCITQAINQFQQWKQGSLMLSPDLRAIVYKFGLQSSNNVEDWEYVWGGYMSPTTSAHEKSKFLTALAATREPWLIRRLLSYAKDPTKIRSQDFFKVFANLADNNVAVDIVWDFLRTEWPNIVKRFSLNSLELGRPFTSVATSFNTPYRVKEMEDFVLKYPDIGAGQLERKQALDKVKRNIEWYSRCSLPLKQAFAQ